MSGGHFDYQQHKIDYIANEIEHLIEKNHIKDENDYFTNFSDETISEFKKAVETLRIAAVYAQRIDWLVSGDDGEDTFHERLKKDLMKLNRE